MVRIEDIERETTHRDKEQKGARKQRREQEDGESRMEERRGKRKRDGQVEIERQEARIRAERLDTSQHSKEETQLTGLGTLMREQQPGLETWGMWRVGSMWRWVREHRRTPKGGTRGRETLEEWEQGRTGTTAGGGT